MLYRFSNSPLSFLNPLLSFQCNFFNKVAPYSLWSHGWQNILQDNKISVLNVEIYYCLVTNIDPRIIFMFEIQACWQEFFSTFTFYGSSVPSLYRGKKAAKQVLNPAGLPALMHSFMQVTNVYWAPTVSRNYARDMTIYLLSRPQRRSRQCRESWRTRTTWHARKHGDHGGAR